MKKVIVLFTFSALFFGIIFSVFLLENEDESGSQDLAINDINIPSNSIEGVYFSEIRSILNIEEDQQKRVQLERFFTSQIQNDAFFSINMISQIQSESDRQLSYVVAFSIWSKNNPYEFHRWLTDQQPNIDLDDALVSLINDDVGNFEKEADVDLESYLLYIEKLFDQNTQHSNVEKLFNTWLLAQPEPIMLRILEQNNLGDTWLSLAFQQLTNDSLVQAINSLNFLSKATNEQLRIAIQSIIDHYKIGSVNQDVLLAIQSLTPYEIREELMWALLPLLTQEVSLTLEDLNSLLESLLPGSVRDSFHEQVALNWAYKNPQEAASYAESLSGETRNLAVNAVVDSWLQTDLEAADQWLSTLDGNIDLAASTIGRGAAQLGNIQIADNWMNFIEDDQIRIDTITDVVGGLYNESPESGIYHLVYQKSLTTQEKLNLLHEIYPSEVFITPMDALDNIGELEGLQSGF